MPRYCKSRASTKSGTEANGLRLSPGERYDHQGAWAPAGFLLGVGKLGSQDEPPSGVRVGGAAVAPVKPMTGCENNA